MKIDLTLCNKELDGDIATYSFNQEDYLTEGGQYLFNWIKNKDLSKSVLVCFENYRGLDNSELRDEQKSILVSHNWDDITDFCDGILSTKTDYDVDFAIFEFNDYQEAFGYCIDLKESF